ncbi:monooxygenase FAD-binding protein [Rhizobium sp. PDO1-076]|uniref:FAD-dependent oxidoreductase n=1 Tax=Rhizobium sp. PDO1-076 TaxID=1125979 RepID=UPI00024E374A|nr:FAD-dependent oxidoreductase [Rhizobium sp. PDO1-076]EHS52716.1 monooxygenase FAD-binding protein [Rhizobium sp. PDO1-076]
MIEPEIDVLISGAGAAGLALAIELARRNVNFRLIDKLEKPFSGSRGKGIQPRTLEVFEDMGIVDRIVAAGGLYPPERQYRADGSFEDKSVFEPGNKTPAEPFATSLMLPQFLTESILRERLLELGHRPEFAHELKDFSQDEDGVVATIVNSTGEETVHARYLVGTDGGRSFVRHALGIGFPGKTLGVRAIVADVVATGVSRDVWHRFNEGDMARQISLCPLSGTDLFQVQGPIPLEGDIDLSAAGLTALFLDRTGRSDIIIQSVFWASAYTMNARLADRYRDGRVFLAGDAAHTHPPTGGQGLNTSVQDAYNLGWKLAAVLGGAPDALLGSYEAERRPIAAGMLGLATKLLDEAKAGSMRRGREVHQLDLCYTGSPLNFAEPAHDHKILAGDRAPDAPIRGRAGQDKRLFDLYQGTHWTLLGYEVDRLSAIAPRAGVHIHAVGPRGDVVDEHGHLHDAYGVEPGDWILVRPDGYVSAVVPSTEINSLIAHLERVGLAAQN